jgi:predicted aminopeptidase
MVRLRRYALATLLATASLGTTGCFTAGYLAQAACGQIGIVHAARSIPKVVADPATPERTRDLLSSVQSIKAYGQAHGLKPTRSYARYSDLDRPAAVWVVQACAPLAFDVKRWQFPIVGSTPYLGFFDATAARDYADTLGAREGLDVEVRGASAYSTLGWFDDPVLSTMILPGDGAQSSLANVVLHESVHATLYVKNQSAFDESVASFVADRLTLSWLEGSFGRDASETRAWVVGSARERTYVERLHRAYSELDALYRSHASDADKRTAKARILAEVREELGLSQPLNNAALAGFKTYETGTPAFEGLLRACGGSWKRFLSVLGTLTETDFQRTQQGDFDAVIERLTARGCVVR